MGRRVVLLVAAMFSIVVPVAVPAGASGVTNAVPIGLGTASATFFGVAEDCCAANFNFQGTLRFAGRPYSGYFGSSFFDGGHPAFSNRFASPPTQSGIVVVNDVGCVEQGFHASWIVPIPTLPLTPRTCLFGGPPGIDLRVSCGGTYSRFVAVMTMALRCKEGLGGAPPTHPFTMHVTFALEPDVLNLAPDAFSEAIGMYTENG